MVPSRSLRVALFLAALAPIAAPPARAAHFDVIYADQVRVTLCRDCAETAPSFAMFVNRGPFSIRATEFLSSAVTVEASRPGFSLIPIVNDPGTWLSPIRSGEAIGSIGGFGSALMSRLLPGEFFRDTSPLQVLAFRVVRNDAAYEGPVTFNVQMQTGAEVATFQITADMRLGFPSVRLLSSRRATSRGGITPTASDSWGTLKQLYR